MGNKRSVSRRSMLSVAVGTALAAGAGVALERFGLLPFVQGAEGRTLQATKLRAMGAPLELSLQASGQPAATSMLAAIRRVEGALSAFLPDSELHRLNQTASDDWVPASPLLCDVFDASVRVYGQTGGAFDPSVGPLLDVWGFRSRPVAPAPQAVRHARQRVGLGLVRREGARIGFERDRMSLDFGGIAVGFAVDRAVEVAHASGVRCGLLNAAGDLRALGPRPDGRPWTVGLRDPFHPDRVFAAVRLHADQAMTTSGTYEKFVATKRGRVSHIFDPRTGESPREVVSATVVATDTVTADALATASVVLGAREAIAMLEQVPGAEGLLVVEGGAGRRLVGTSAMDAEVFYDV